VTEYSHHRPAVNGLISFILSEQIKKWRGICLAIFIKIFLLPRTAKENSYSTIVLCPFNHGGQKVKFVVGVIILIVTENRLFFSKPSHFVTFRSAGVHYSFATTTAQMCKLMFTFKSAQFLIFVKFGCIL